MVSWYVAYVFSEWFWNGPIRSYYYWYHPCLYFPRALYYHYHHHLILIVKIYVINVILEYRGADKSLARPGRKQATATKLWLSRVTQKKFRRLSIQPGLCGSSDLHVGRKMATFQLFFQSGRAKDLSAPLYQYLTVCSCCSILYYRGYKYKDCKFVSFFVFFPPKGMVDPFMVKWGLCLFRRVLMCCLSFPWIWHLDPICFWLLHTCAGIRLFRQQSSYWGNIYYLYCLFILHLSYGTLQCLGNKHGQY